MQSLSSQIRIVIVGQWHTLPRMVIIETSIFTKKISALLSEEEYRALQNVLVEKPGSGDIIQGSGGIRKIRWGSCGRGKRGGVRVIYFWANNHD